MHYYKRNIGDYAKKAGRLSMLEHGAYTLLIDACYDRERFPTLEEALDWAWARTEAEESAVKFVLSKFFTLVDGVYVQNRIKEELAEYKEKAETNTRIAKEREEKRKLSKQKVNDFAPVVNESCEKTHEPSPNQEPITNNQEPITNNQEPINNKQTNTREFEKNEQSIIDNLTSEPKNFVMPFDWQPNQKEFNSYCVHLGVDHKKLTSEILSKFIAEARSGQQKHNESKWCKFLATYLKKWTDNPTFEKKPNPHIYQPEQQYTPEPSVDRFALPEGIGRPIVGKPPVSEEERARRKEIVAQARKDLEEKIKKQESNNG